MSNKVHGVYFLAMADMDKHESISAAFGLTPGGLQSYLQRHPYLKDRFKSVFCKHVVPGDYYFFIITEATKEGFLAHLKAFNIEDKYIKYKSNVPIANVRYGLEPRLNVYILQFDEQWTNLWKEDK